MKLNGWQRIGIVASAFWFVGAGLTCLKVLGDQEDEREGISYSACADVRDQSDMAHRKECADRTDPSTDFNECLAQFQAEHDRLDKRCSDQMLKQAMDARPIELEGAAFFAIAPIPIAWGLAYFILFLVRWIRRGFTAK